MDQYQAVQPMPEPIVGLDVFPPERHRRWTVLLRAILAIPQLLVLVILGLATAVVAVIGWFGALFLGALPEWCGDFLRSTFAYTIRVLAYMYLLVDVYPPFSLDVEANYPVRVQFPAPTRLNRWAVFFRFILAIPILALNSWMATGWTVIAVIVWLIMLITGRMPAMIFQATAAVLRCQVRTDAYWLMLTPAYLTGVFGDGPVPQPGMLPAPGYVPASPTRPLLVSQGAKVLLWIILVLGILWNIFNPTPDFSTDTGRVEPTTVYWPTPTP
ncbi:DUF4389 domain-containing protein [Nocardia sp. NPDC059240]|uniref:DUF4389 domain-containing protein n=1 Tax=Nocardia sp. NPDC059240 TaxID=3346786 RepID=UPI0036A274D1